MIQRVQSVYLLLVTILMSFFLVRPYAFISLKDGQILNFHAHKIEYSQAGESTSVYKKTISVIMLVFITGLLSLSNIFLFHHRIKQMRICLLNGVLILILIIILIIHYNSAMHSLDTLRHTWRLAAVFPALALVMNVMAYRSIQHDEMLVNSYNRIR
ncbi:MAG: DUF4293 domain-containing protein [Bacteroidales bacterium]|nr:DUF4293 domain-containing protein [Bacteroidales bacterium]